MREEAYCINCREDGNFEFTGTKANGDFWKCRTCGEEFESTVENKQ